MIRHLKLQNFKSWREADLEFGKVTALFGTNSSGKTSLIQFLLLLKQTKEATDRTISLDLNGPYVKLGVYEDMVYGHDGNSSLEWDLAFQREKELTFEDSSGRYGGTIERSKEFKLVCRVGLRRNTPTAMHLLYWVGDAGFSLAPRTESDWKFDLTTKETDFSFVRTKGRAWELPGPVKSYAFPDQAKTYYQNAHFLADLEIAYEKEMDNIFYLGPLRQFPQRDYLWARSRPKDVGTQGERAIDAILAATDEGEERNLYRKGRYKSFQEMIAYWLQKMGLVEGFRIEEIKKGSNRWQAKVRTRAGGPEVLLTDVGFGVSQVLPVLTLLQYVPDGSTVILEQPEIHLHPLAQAELADAIVNVATHPKRCIQVIVESHSEHLLLRLQRRIAEEKIKANDAKLYFCDIDRKGSSRLIPLKIDLFGNILNWPDKFMGDAFGEASAAEIARLKRMKADAAE